MPSSGACLLSFAYRYYLTLFQTSFEPQLFSHRRFGCWLVSSRLEGPNRPCSCTSLKVFYLIHSSLLLHFCVNERSKTGGVQRVALVTSGKEIGYWAHTDPSSCWPFACQIAVQRDILGKTLPKLNNWWLLAPRRWSFCPNRRSKTAITLRLFPPQLIK